ncbi:MAG: UDP-N-acetylglucosamine 1-carboxyvinyltransferase [Bacteroidales bacterium]|nr:UDP-N-acetylglucosamine 1-carboxyvinyltransferase [Bacteroidales bacterium]
MSYYEIIGGHRLKGEIIPQGAKNEALQVISAVLLTSDEITIENVPEIKDVLNLIEILEGFNVKVQKISPNTFTFKADNIDINYLDSPDFRSKGGKLRGSIMIIGPLLARFGKAILPKPGGDKIGRRRLDTHLIGLETLGVKFDYKPGDSFYSLKTNHLKGTYLLMDEASVTGTANLIMAAVLAEGTTTIYNAACEPYIQQLCKMLVKMGADIKGISSNLLTINGVESLKGCCHRLLPDMIEIGSFIGMAALTQSEITIKNVCYNELGIIPNVFRKLGIHLELRNDDIYIPAHKEYEIASFIDGSIQTIYDATWPGFSPDLLSIVLVTAIQAKGSVLIHQKMFESRLFFVDKLIEMGAQIILCDPHRATVIGSNRKFPLRGIEMTSPDIRAGVALLIAALSAQGKSIILNIEQIDRGYEKIEQRLNAIGANIKRIG